MTASRSLSPNSKSIRDLFETGSLTPTVAQKNTDEDRLARALLYYTYSDITIEDDFNRLSSIPRKSCRHCSSNPIAAVSHRCKLTM